MRRRAFTLIEALVVAAICAILAAILFPTFGRTHCDGRREDCQSTIKQISLGFAQYIQDYDEKFPPVAVARSGYWVGSLQPYLKTWQIFQCPTPKNHKSKTTDYFYNRRVAGVGEAKFIAISFTVLVAEGSDDSPLNYSLTELPQSWLENEKSPAWRHLKGANYAFADGHVKWVKPSYIGTVSPAQQNVFSFALS